jgi:hypothetical protein
MIVSFSFSCEDATIIIQPGELGPNVTFQTVNDLQLGLNMVCMLLLLLVRIR